MLTKCLFFLFKCFIVCCFSVFQQRARTWQSRDDVFCSLGHSRSVKTGSSLLWWRTIIKSWATKALFYSVTMVVEHSGVAFVVHLFRTHSAVVFSGLLFCSILLDRSMMVDYDPLVWPLSGISMLIEEMFNLAKSSHTLPGSASQVLNQECSLYSYNRKCRVTWANSVHFSNRKVMLAFFFFLVAIKLRNKYKKGGKKGLIWLWMRHVRGVAN